MISYQQIYKLRQSDFDFHDNIKFSSFLDFFQDIASLHAETSGLGFLAMKKLGVAWVVTKIKFEVYGDFHPYENIKIITYPHKKGVIDYIRDYYVYNEKGDLTCKGSSQWCHIDFEKRKLVKPQADFTGEFYNVPAFKGRLERVFPCDDAPIKLTHTINKTDLDHNNHTNNIKYADMVYNVLPNEIKVKSFIINYIKESTLGDKIDLHLKQEENSFIVSGFCKGEECFSAKVTY